VKVLLRRSGFELERSATVGFGPFTFWNRELLPAAAGRRVHRFLQARADRNVRTIAGRGAHHVVLVRRTEDAASPGGGQPRGRASIGRLGQRERSVGDER
jgi:hypothetical protein